MGEGVPTGQERVILIRERQRDFVNNLKLRANSL
jgi:hypothetical protein